MTDDWEGLAGSIVIAPALPGFRALGARWSAFSARGHLISAASWSHVFGVASAYAEQAGLRLIDRTWDDDLLEDAT